MLSEQSWQCPPSTVKPSLTGTKPQALFSCLGPLSKSLTNVLPFQVLGPGPKHIFFLPFTSNEYSYKTR